MAIECGAKSGLISPDEKTFKYLEGREYSPKNYEKEVEKWKEIISDKDAKYDKIVIIDLEKKLPVITWGTNPEQSVNIDEKIPSPEDFKDKAKSFACKKSLAYTKLES
jgi:3-isopropylmalate/(R)-2-methylmalate dehydratase large subunit